MRKNFPKEVFQLIIELSFVTVFLYTDILAQDSVNVENGSAVSTSIVAKDTTYEAGTDSAKINHIQQTGTDSSERVKFIYELKHLNDSLNVATSEDQKKAITEKIKYLKQKLASIDSSNTRPQVIQTTEREKLLQEIELTKKKINEAKTEEEKKAYTQKLEAIKKRLSAIENGTANQINKDTIYTSERNKLLNEIKRQNDSLSVATSENQKKVITEKIKYLKQKLASIDSTDTKSQQVVQVNIRENMLLEIESLNKMLSGAKTEEEKKAITVKLEYLKNRINSIDNSTTSWSTTDSLSKKEMILRQIESLQKALTAAKNEDDKKLFTSKIVALKDRLAQLDSISTTSTYVKDTISIQKVKSEIVIIDEKIKKKKQELTIAIKSNEKEKVIVIEREITVLLEKKKSFESNIVASNKVDSSKGNLNNSLNDSLKLKNSPLDLLKGKYECLQSQMDTLNYFISELKKNKIEAEIADKKDVVDSLEKQITHLNDKINQIVVAMEKIRIEGEQLESIVKLKVETTQLKETAGEIKIVADSLLQAMQKKNKERNELIKSSNDAEKVASITEELHSLKEEYLKAHQTISSVRQEINNARLENNVVQKELQIEKIALVASDNKNSRGLYEVTMKKGNEDTLADTSKMKKVQVKLNVLEKVGGEIEIAEEIIDESPAGKKGLIAFDITPSVDLLVNMEDAEIELPFDIEDIMGIDVQKLKIYHLNIEKGWEPVEGCRIDAERKVVIAKVTHFSVYGIFIDEETSISVQNRKKPEMFTLVTKNFRESVTLDFTLPEKSFVQIYIYSLNGKLIAKPVAGMYKEGSYSVIWNGRNGFRSTAASGKYTVKLLAKNNSLTKTFTLLK